MVRNVDQVIATARCYECGQKMEGRKGVHKYTECGLTSVSLKDILVFRCTNCSAVVPEIPAVGVLHRVIALRLIFKNNLLSGSEIRFLRKFCGYSVNEFAEIIGSSKSVVSRWEKGGCGEHTDRILRLLVLVKLTRELSGQSEPTLKNVTVEQLHSMMDRSFKVLEGKAKANEKYIISPEEIAKYTGVSDEILESSEVAVH